MKKKIKHKEPSAKQPVQPPHKNYAVQIIVPLILLITFISFYPSVHDGFVGYDDGDYVYYNRMIQKKDVAFNELFTTPVSLNYHPLTMLSLALNFQASGLEPAPYHYTNVILHLLNTLLVFLLIYGLSGMVNPFSSAFLRSQKKPILHNHQVIVASVASLFFGIHPLHVESVTWVSERKDVLYAFFYLLALIVYLGYIKKAGWLKYALVFLFFVCSCFSKAVAVSLPLLMILMDFFAGRKITWKTLAEKIPFLATAVIFGIVTLKIQAHAFVMSELTVMGRFVVACYCFVIYLVKLIVPYELCAFYPYPALDGKIHVPGTYFIFPFLVAAIFYLAYLWFKPAKWFAFGLLFYSITVALVLEFISVGLQIMADRYTYLPCIGVYFIIGTGASYLIHLRVSDSPYAKTAIAGVLLIWALAFSVITWQRTKIWKDSLTLWTDAIEKEPTGAIAWNGKAAAEGRDLHDYKSALEDCNKAIGLNQNFADAYANRGNVENSLGDYQGAISDYTKTLELDNTKQRIYIMRAHLYLLLNNYQAGISDFNQAIRFFPDDADLYNDRGTLRGKSNDYEGAISDFSQTIRLKPDSGLAYYNKAACELALNRKAQACDDCRKAFARGFNKVPDLCK